MPVAAGRASAFSRLGPVNERQARGKRRSSSGGGAGEAGGEGRSGPRLPGSRHDLRASLSRRSAVPDHMLNALNNAVLTGAGLAPL